MARKTLVELTEQGTNAPIAISPWGLAALSKHPNGALVRVLGGAGFTVTESYEEARDRFNAVLDDTESQGRDA